MGNLEVYAEAPDVFTHDNRKLLKVVVSKLTFLVFGKKAFHLSDYLTIYLTLLGQIFRMSCLW